MLRRETQATPWVFAEARRALRHRSRIADAAVDAEDQALETVDAMRIDAVAGDAGGGIGDQMGPVCVHTVGQELLLHDADGLVKLNPKHSSSSLKSVRVVNPRKGAYCQKPN